MPTFPKLFAGIWFAILGYVAVFYYVPHLPEGTQVGRLFEVSAAIGFIVGWMWLGPRARTGLGEAAGTGFVTAFLLLFWVMLCFSIVVMLERSLDKRYKDVMEALIGIFDLMIYYGAFLVHPVTPMILVIGGFLGGMVTKFVAARTS